MQFIAATGIEVVPQGMYQGQTMLLLLHMNAVARYDAQLVLAITGYRQVFFARGANDYGDITVTIDDNWTTTKRVGVHG